MIPSSFLAYALDVSPCKHAQGVGVLLRQMHLLHVRYRPSRISAFFCRLPRAMGHLEHLAETRRFTRASPTSSALTNHALSIHLLKIFNRLSSRFRDPRFILVQALLYALTDVKVSPAPLPLRASTMTTSSQPSLLQACHLTRCTFDPYRFPPILAILAFWKPQFTYSRSLYRLPALNDVRLFMSLSHHVLDRFMRTVIVALRTRLHAQRTPPSHRAFILQLVYLAYYLEAPGASHS